MEAKAVTTGNVAENGGSVHSSATTSSVSCPECSRRPDRPEDQALSQQLPARPWVVQQRQLDIKSQGGSARFLLVSLIPSLVLVSYIVALVATGVFGREPELQHLRTAATDMNVLEIAALALIALVVAQILQPMQGPLLRLLEGYWDGSAVGQAISMVGIARHRRRLRRLEAIVQSDAQTAAEQRRSMHADARLRLYPDEDRLLPTRLGNVLRAAEDRAGQRYGLETVVVWPRLYPYTSGSLQMALVDARNQLDGAVRLCSVLLLATVISTVMLFAQGWWRVVPLATALLAWAAYRAAVQAAASYGRGLYVAFDLHRFDMLEGLHLPLPASPMEEWDFNEELSNFFATDMRAPMLHLTQGYWQGGNNPTGMAATSQPAVRDGVTPSPSHEPAGAIS